MLFRKWNIDNQISTWVLKKNMKSEFIIFVWFRKQAHWQIGANTLTKQVIMKNTQKIDIRKISLIKRGSTERFFEFNFIKWRLKSEIWNITEEVTSTFNTWLYHGIKQRVASISLSVTKILNFDDSIPIRHLVNIHSFSSQILRVFQRLRIDLKLKFNWC